MKNMRYINLFLLILLCSGCWDRSEIEQIGFVMGVGLDPVKNEEKQEDTLTQDQKNMMKHDHGHLFTSTFQVAIPGQLQDTNHRYFTISSSGLTNFKIRRNTAARRSRHFKFEHLKVIVIHQELARKGMLKHLIDFYLRDHEMRRRVMIFISEGDTKSLFEQKLPLEDMTSQSYMMINENERAELGMLEPTMIGDVSEQVIGNKSFLVPRIISNHPNDVRISGAAIIQGTTDKMIGWLGVEEVEGYNWVMGKAGNGAIEAPGNDEGAPFVFETLQQSSRTTYMRQNEQDHFHIEIRAEGAIPESWIHSIDLNNPETISQLEENLSQKIKKQAVDTITKMQEEFHADIFQLSKLVHRKNPDYWRDIKDNWDGKEGKFSEAHFTVEVKTQIRSYMLNEKI